MIGELKYVNGLFLGKEELIRQQTFFNNSLISLIRTSGLRGLYPLRGKYEVDFNGNTMTLSGPTDIMGIDNLQQTIYFDREKSVNLTDYIGSTVYISLSANPSNKEVGTVSLSSTGVLTGVGTKFADVLRGSYTKKGTKVYFPSVEKSYLVESITSNTVAKLIGPIAGELTNVEYQVIGTFSPFSVIQLENSFPYLYHSYSITASLDLPDELTSFVIGRITWNGSTPVFEFIQNKVSILGSGTNNSAFDYIVDSDEALRLLRSNSQVTNVLIKKGTYTYTSPDGKGIVLHPNTKLVWAEGGSLIKVFSTPAAANGSFAIGYNNEPPHDVQVYNLNVENNVFPSGYKNLNNLINCRLRYTASSASYGFDTCSRLTNCRAISVNGIGIGMFNCFYLDACWAEGFSTGYANSRSLNRCHAEITNGYSLCYASRRNELANACTDTADGGFNSSLGDIPAPPVTNYNRISLQMVIGDLQEPILRVTAEQNVASLIVFETLIVNGIGKEEVINISLLVGEKTKDKSAIGLTDPSQLYSISNVIASVQSDGTFTYQINY